MIEPAPAGYRCDGCQGRCHPKCYGLRMARNPETDGGRYLRLATATPSKNAIRSDPNGASRAMLLNTLSGIPGLRPESTASPILFAVPFTASATSLITDFSSGAGSSPS